MASKLQHDDWVGTRTCVSEPPGHPANGVLRGDGSTQRLRNSVARKLERVSEMGFPESVRLVPVAPVILDKFRLDDKVAVVTGGGRGLGAAIALAFADVGADVVIASRTQSELEAVAEKVRAAGRRAHIVTADLAQPEVTAELAGQAVEAFGRLDIVVNNVGGTMPNGLLTTSTKDLKSAFTFNVATAHALTIAAAPLMLVPRAPRRPARARCARLGVTAIPPGWIATPALDVLAPNEELREPMEKVTP